VEGIRIRKETVMQRVKLGFTLLMLATLWAFSAQANYGTVEFMNGRILNGQIEVSGKGVSGFPVKGKDYQIGLFVPDDGAYMIVSIMDIKRIEFNWNKSDRAEYPYYLRNKGDIKVYKINGDVIHGSYFGSAAKPIAIKTAITT